MLPGTRRTLVIVLVGCFIGLNLIAYLITSAGQGRRGWGTREPEVPLYPGAQQIHRQRNDLLGWQNITFKVLEESYPSTKVLEYYRTTLKAQGYRRSFPDKESKWIPNNEEKTSRKLTIGDYWVDAAGLRVFEINISATEKLDRDPANERVINSTTLPGLKVECILSRKVVLEPEKK